MPGNPPFCSFAFLKFFSLAPFINKKITQGTIFMTSFISSFGTIGVVPDSKFSAE